MSHNTWRLTARAIDETDIQPPKHNGHNPTPKPLQPPPSDATLAILEEKANFIIVANRAAVDALRAPKGRRRATSHVAT